MVRQYFPYPLQFYLTVYTHKLFSYFYPCIQLTIPEYSGGGMARSEACAAVESYLADEHAGGARVWWLVSRELPDSQTITLHAAQATRRYYRLSFHRRHRKLVVVEEGCAAAVNNRQRRLFTNNPGGSWDDDSLVWSHMAFEHPSTFDTLAMDPVKKQEVIDDLTQFRDGKEYLR